jgi:hypothetical protein
MKKVASLALAAAAVLAAGSATYAHHSFSMFDPSQEIVVEGKVVRWAFNSPHTFMIIEDAEGETWAFEGAAPPSLIPRNLTGNTFQPGDEIIVIQCPLRDGRPGGAAGLFIAADGTVYNPSDAGCRANQRTEQWPEWIAAGHRTKADAEAATGGDAAEAEGN